MTIIIILIKGINHYRNDNSYNKYKSSEEYMSRNNVFKLSGNMALGSNNDYANNDFENIKSSLKLLKSKQTQKRQDMPSEPTNPYGGSYSSNAPTRQPQIPKNLPSNDYQNSYNYPQTNSRNTNQASNSYKDVAYQMEQHYPTNDYKPKKNTQHYQPTYQEQNHYAKPQPSRQQQQQPPQRQQEYKEKNRNNGNEYEQRNIKEINRQNRVQMKEYHPSELIECGQGCGRKFNPDSISKHEGICRKVFQKKRKQFNAQDQRIVANEQKKLMRKGQMVDKKIEEKKAQEKMPKWKIESLQLRSGIKQSQGDNYVPTKQEKLVMEAAKSHLIKCQFCGRTFNEEAGKKHVTFCESQQKKNQMRRK